MVTFKEYLLLEEISKTLMDKLSKKIKIPEKDIIIELLKMTLK